MKQAHDEILEKIDDFPWFLYAIRLVVGIN